MLRSKKGGCSAATHSSCRPPRPTPLSARGPLSTPPHPPHPRSARGPSSLRPPVRLSRSPFFHSLSSRPLLRSSPHRTATHLLQPASNRSLCRPSLSLEPTAVSPSCLPPSRPPRPPPHTHTQAQDLVIPIWRPPLHYARSPLQGAPAKPRDIFLFFRGDVGKKRSMLYSRGVRQKVRARVWVCV